MVNDILFRLSFILTLPWATSFATSAAACVTSQSAPKAGYSFVIVLKQWGQLTRIFFTL